MDDTGNKDSVLRQLSQIHQKLEIIQRDADDVAELMAWGMRKALSDGEREIWIKLMEEERKRIFASMQQRQSED